MLCIGLIHVVFVWTGDILHTYAIAGFFLIRKWKFDLHRLKKSIIFNLALATILLAGIYSLNSYYISQIGQELYTQQMLLQREAIIGAFQQGSYLEILQTRLSFELINAFINNLFVIPNVLALFLMGLYVGKLQIHKDICKHKDIIKRTWKVTFVAGLIANSLLFVLMQMEAGGNTSWIKEVVKYYAGIIICFFYITSIILIGDTKLGTKMIRPFSYVGRMALTNYLVQTIICVMIFYGYGMGYFGRVGYGMGVIIACAIYAVQMVYSKLWFGHFSYGPVEWLWRRLTYKAQTR